MLVIRLTLSKGVVRSGDAENVEEKSVSAENSRKTDHLWNWVASQFEIWSATMAIDRDQPHKRMQRFARTDQGSLRG